MYKYLNSYSGYKYVIKIKIMNGLFFIGMVLCRINGLLSNNTNNHDWAQVWFDKWKKLMKMIKSLYLILSILYITY
jgi:hypothetical protein